jgi:thymidylate synthase (FAD)
MDIQFRTDMTVELVECMGSDESILRAMLASTAKAHEVDGYSEEQKFGKINFLMKNRHGTPFEHAALTFYEEMPIVVFREYHRHRIGWSYNEMSGRYVELPPVFYVPAPDRNLVQQGKPGHYEFVPGTPEQHERMRIWMVEHCSDAYACYQAMLAEGIAKEVARMVLPGNIFSAQYATCNPRSLMAFLSLRTNRDPFWVKDIAHFDHPEYPDGADLYRQNEGGAMFPSKPMREIEMVAEDVESVFAEKFPLTHRAFCENGRVCP